jgi:Arginine/lysine/ornithine decarboxylases
MKAYLSGAVSGRKGHISFHTPAHGGSLNEEDITELSYSDNLLSPSGAIKFSEEEIAKAYGAEKAFYVTSGATVAVQIAVETYKDKKILVLPGAHRSVFEAIRLFGAEGYYGGNSSIEEALEKIEPGAVLLTYPDYFGNCFDIKAVSEKIKNSGAKLIVDSAHGSHFKFSSKMPVPATKYGDIVTHSLHKTMPALTGAALILCRGEEEERVFRSFKKIHSTSPSYPVMLSVERAVKKFSGEGEALYGKVLSEIKKFREKLPAPYAALENGDKTRLVISSPYRAPEVSGYLEKNGLFPEAALFEKLVFIVTPYNYKNLKLLSSLLKIAPAFELRVPASFPSDSGLQKIISAEGEIITISPLESSGRISASDVGFYPPGVPVVFEGQEISGEAALFIEKNKGKLFGLDNGLIYVLK